MSNRNGGDASNTGGLKEALETADLEVQLLHERLDATTEALDALLDQTVLKTEPVQLGQVKVITDMLRDMGRETMNRVNGLAEDLGCNCRTEPRPAAGATAAAH